MALADELLEPITEEQPAGEDLSAGPEYAEIERAYRDADVPADMVFMAGENSDSDFSAIIGLAEAFLGTRSKDIQIATYLTAALLRTDGFPGLAEGLDLLRGLLDRFWDDVHPDPQARSAVLGWLGGDDPRGMEPLLRLAYALQLTPLTDDGHTYFHYREFKRLEDEGELEDAKAEADEISAATFGPAMENLSWEWYNEHCEAIARCNLAVERLGEFGPRFEDADATPPRYKDLADSLKRVGAAAAEIRSRKPAPVTAEIPADAGEPTSAIAPAGGGAKQVVLSEPRDAGEAATAIGAAARVLRRIDPTDPSPYLLIRAFRFGELVSLGPEPDPTSFAKALAAPTTKQRTRLKTLFLDEQWADLLETAEELASTPAGRGWLDLHRYVALAADRLGPGYEIVSQSVKTAIERLLADVPNLVDATLMDDVSTTSRDTKEWLEVHGLLDPATRSDAPKPDGSVDTDADRAVREASFSRAAALVRAGDPQAAIELLLDRAEHESSERERFIIRSEALEIMLDHGMKSYALPLLKELNDLIARHSLEEWEPPEIVAKPLTLLYRCLDDGVSMKQELHDRLSRLDPVFFMHATRAIEKESTRGTDPAPAKGQVTPQSPEPETDDDDELEKLLGELEDEDES